MRLLCPFLLRDIKQGQLTAGVPEHHVVVFGQLAFTRTQSISAAIALAVYAGSRITPSVRASNSIASSPCARGDAVTGADVIVNTVTSSLNCAPSASPTPRMILPTSAEIEADRSSS